MNWFWSRFTHRVSFDGDPLGDPLNAGWDAVVRRERVSLPNVDLDDIAFLRRVHALEIESLPSPSFFGDLERRLEDLYPPPSASSNRRTLDKGQRADSAKAALARTRSASRTSRWFSMQGALAVLSVMLAASLLILYQAVPRSWEPPAIPAAVVAAPTMQPLLQFDFDPPMWGMPEGTSWTHMDFSLITLDPGKSFDTNAGWYTSTDGPFLIEVLSGDLEIDPRGPAVVYPADHAQQPQPVDPGQLARLGPEDAIVFSVADSALGTNLGGDRVTALFGLTGSEDSSVPGAYTMPSDVSSWEFQAIDDMPVLPTKGAVVSIQRLELLPYDSLIFDPNADWHYLPAFDSANLPGLHIADGAVERLSPNTKMTEAFSASSLLFYVPGPHTLFNLADKAIVIYFFVVEPYPAQAASTPS